MLIQAAGVFSRKGWECVRDEVFSAVRCPICSSWARYHHALPLSTESGFTLFPPFFRCETRVGSPWVVHGICLKPCPNEINVCGRLKIFCGSVDRCPCGAHPIRAACTERVVVVLCVKTHSGGSTLLWYYYCSARRFQQERYTWFAIKGSGRSLTRLAVLIIYIWLGRRRNCAACM